MNVVRLDQLARAVRRRTGAGAREKPLVSQEQRLTKQRPADRLARCAIATNPISKAHDDLLDTSISFRRDAVPFLG
ncbi:MAG TPA: hypothetical protein VE974_02115 [Thermoanaerobaculia bacterium]|nr:hypothetical protein [Thermoanaerobaculia bacterium]